MDRRAALLALAITALPAMAGAQAWPSGSVVSVGAMRLPPKPQPVAPPTWTQPPPRPPAQPEPWPPQSQRLRAIPITDEAPPPAVELRARSEWTDDQGLRATPTRVSYKLRF